MAKTKSEFVKLRKPGEDDIEVNPSVVEDHKRLGWKVVEENEPQADAESAEAKAAEKKAAAAAKAAEKK